MERINREGRGGLEVKRVGQGWPSRIRSQPKRQMGQIMSNL